MAKRRKSVKLSLVKLFKPRRSRFSRVRNNPIRRRTYKNPPKRRRSRKQKRPAGRRRRR